MCSGGNERSGYLEFTIEVGAGLQDFFERFLSDLDQNAPAFVNEPVHGAPLYTN